MSTITKIFNYLNGGNIFEKIDTPVQKLDIIKGSSPINYYKRSIGFITAGIILLTLAMARFGNFTPNLQFWSIIGGILLLLSFACTVIIAASIDYRKLLKFPPNKIIDM